MKTFAGEKTGRRRRSWYRRRLRVERGLIGGVVALLFVAASWQVATRLLAYHARHDFPSPTDSAWTRGNIPAKLSAQAAARASKPARAPELAVSVYPYSVVPGGVRDGEELRRAAEHDRLVWQHYARFQFEHARLVRANDAHEVYLSYRLRNHIYWTRKRHRLHLGELLLTDGKITARARCGNQISETPKADTSEEEPVEDVLDRPVAQLEPPPLPIRLSLAVPSLPGSDPVAPQGPELFRGGGFIFPYVPFGVPLSGLCETPAQEAFELSHGISDNEKDEKHCLPKRHKPPVVPEPSTILLVCSGIALVCWQYHRARLAQTR